jgi:hypothetical protein
MKKIRKSKGLSTAETQRFLGAERPIPVGKLSIDPISMKAIASIVQERLVSRGGRPSDPAWTIVRKVPMRAETWEKLARCARQLQDENVRVSAGQVAAIALEQGLTTTVKSTITGQLATSNVRGRGSVRYEHSQEVQVRARRAHLAVARNNGSIW